MKGSNMAIKKRSAAAWDHHADEIREMTKGFACNPNSEGLQALLRLLFELGYAEATLASTRECMDKVSS
jgi:hypothetical protein